MKILITGGAGYIGTLLFEELLKVGHEVLIVDNFFFGFDSVLHRLTSAPMVAHKYRGFVTVLCCFVWCGLRSENLKFLVDGWLLNHRQPKEKYH